jgi:hypothetical protein
VGPTSNDGLKGILRVGGGDRRVKHIAQDQHSPPRVPVMPPQRLILNPWHSPDEDRYQRSLVSGQFVNKFSWLDGVESDELEAPSQSACARGVFSKE